VRPDDVWPEKLARFGSDDVAVIGAAPESRVVWGNQIWPMVLEPELAGALPEGGEVGFGEHGISYHESKWDTPRIAYLPLRQSN